MTDKVSKQKRSAVMAAVKSEGNRSTEIKLVRILRQYHLMGWRRKQPLFGKPDFVFRHERVVVFVDGCFWHGCPRCYRRPHSHQKFWDAKIAHNKERARLVNRELKKQGWRVARVWEHELRHPARVAFRIQKALRAS